MPPAGALATASRAATLRRLGEERFDLAVIGGGITGAGLAREAALRGLRVALLEARDFASGTSSRSSKLIHGGLRYLAMGDVALVRSTALERKVIHRLAPHLAEPRWMVVPTRSYAGLMKLRAGITTYEKLGAVEERDLHRNWGKDELAQEEPLLRRDRYGHACVYREYLTDDARLVLANLRAAASRGAVVLNHAPVVEITSDGAAADGVVAECTLGGGRVRVRAHAVVNAAGPWVDAVRKLEAPDEVPARLLLSKGVHIVVPAERLPVRNLLILNTEDRRSIFVIPRGRSVYVGTTDTEYEPGVETEPRITRADVAYLLAPVNRDLDAPTLTPEDVSAAWAGLRPLIAEPGKKPSEISRKDEVWVGPRRVITIAGGKLTGYRPMARMTLERTAEVAGLAPAEPPDEAEEPLLPGGAFEGDVSGIAARLRRETGLAEDPARRLADLYGAEAPEVAARGAEPLVPGGEVVAGEIPWAVEVEAAATLEDVLVRRTRASLYSPGERDGLVPVLGERLAARLGWDAARRAREEEATRELLAREMAFQEEPS
ncbi:MAG: glycerol-3-phosphate dehydrogenase/oxidase [Myxococcota bacterium]|nr:glycerol-3-phosphate dehydrogenase/oxidase [Myxococcota bacterium]